MHCNQSHQPFLPNIVIHILGSVENVTVGDTKKKLLNYTEQDTTHLCVSSSAYHEIQFVVYCSEAGRDPPFKAVCWLFSGHWCSYSHQPKQTEHQNLFYPNQPELVRFFTFFQTNAKVFWNGTQILSTVLIKSFHRHNSALSVTDDIVCDGLIQNLL